MKSRIQGCRAEMTKFSFVFGLLLSQRLFSITDNLSQALQERKICAISGQRMVRATLATFEGMRSEEAFELLYASIQKKAESYSMVEEPKLGRKRSKPDYSILQFVEGYNEGQGHQFESAKDMYRRIYFEAIDCFIVTLKYRFDQPSFQVFAALEELLLSIIKNDSIDKGMKVLHDVYSEDVEFDKLEVEIPIFRQLFKNSSVLCFTDVVDHLQNLTDERCLIPNVMIIIYILMVNPATSATPDRSFSLARRIKTWQRATMSQRRFNSLAILNCHKDETDKIDLVSVGNDFVSKHNERYRTIGKFVKDHFNV